MHGVSKIRTLIEEDPILRDELKQIKDVLEAGE
jgi:hypothetical protein